MKKLNLEKTINILAVCPSCNEKSLFKPIKKEYYKCSNCEGEYRAKKILEFNNRDVYYISEKIYRERFKK